MRQHARTLIALTFFTVATAVFATAAPAAAKGPDHAIITGPGLAEPIRIGGSGEPGSTDDLGQLATGSGLFGLMFGASAGSGERLPAAPPGALGPKFKITYRIPDGSAIGATFRQDLFPAATGGPVTFAADGQEVFGSVVAGGWYRPPDGFAALLIKLKVPGVVSPSPAGAATPAYSASAPAPAPGDNRSLPAGPLAWIGAALIAIGLASVVLWHRTLRFRAGAARLDRTGGS